MSEIKAKAAGAPIMPSAANDPRYQPFFEGLQRGEVKVRQCTNCGRWQWPPHDLCFECQGSEFEWHLMPTTGEVYSFTVMNRAFDPYHQDKLPYGVVIVALGPVHITGRFLGDPESLRCGLQVALAWDELALSGHSPAFSATA
ncbi:hypothetical protein HMPREF3104_02020 [Corynebacterium sp. HMSC30G07]|nr:hypothetical protein HMPREF3104_02020 [Corynebacterium sp. HMSC30G07]